MSTAASTSSPTPPINALQWLERGHHRAAGGTRDDLLAALECYDQARQSCPGDTSDPDTLHHLGLAWMNRGNILQQWDDPSQLIAALNAYDAALAAFSSLPRSPGLINTVAAARINRGRARLRRDDRTEAIEDFTAALDLLRPLLPTNDLSVLRNAAGAAINLAQLLLQTADEHAAARALLGEARSWLTPHETSDAIAATLSLESARLELIDRTRTLTRDTLDAFTDLAESALALAASWHHREHPTALTLAAHLFQLGAHAYAQCQPQFLIEFLRESLDADTGAAPFVNIPHFHAIADKLITALRADLTQPRLFQADDPASHNLLELRQELAGPFPWLKPNESTS